MKQQTTMDKPFTLLWSTTSLSEQDRSELMPLLTVSERARAESLGELRAQRYLAGRSLARKLGGQLLDQDWASVIPLAHCRDCGMDHGAITLTGTDVHISLSSSGSQLVAAGIRSRQIGVDIERGALADMRTVAGSSGTHDVTLAQWCEYEALMKARGVGITLGFEEFDLTRVSKEYELHEAQQHDDVVLAVALRSE